ncbi:hypothetical protein REPUB_Repub08aG0100700 [Reevesia pubescens]
MLENSYPHRSGEEYDLLVRSTQKIKARDDIGNEVVMSDNNHPRVSFKEMVLGTQANHANVENDVLGPLDENDGRSIGFKVLDARIRKLWNLKADYELLDLGDGYFLVKFTSFSDMQFVLVEVPWIVFGHYLTIRQWEPEFRPCRASIDSTAVWVRFPDGNWQPVEYEGLNLICFTRGRMGHKGIWAFEKLVEKLDDAHGVTKVVAGLNENRKAVHPHADDYGSWMIALTCKGKRSSKMQPPNLAKDIVIDGIQVEFRFVALSKDDDVVDNSRGNFQMSAQGLERVAMSPKALRHTIRKEKPIVKPKSNEAHDISEEKAVGCSLRHMNP